MKKLQLLIKSILLLNILLLLHSCAVNPVTGKRQFVLVSEEQEKAMGKQYNPQVVSSMGLYDDAKLQEFIDRKGNEMAKISHRPNLKYKFQIVNSSVVNAFAVPGGYVYFTRGIMAHFNSEAEFMGVLGHELGHITARHSVVQQSKQKLYSIGLMGAMVLVPELQQFGNQAMQGLQLLFLKFGRDDETQADKLGVEYSTKVGYDANQMADFFQVLKRLQLKNNPNGVPSFLSTHPDPADRYNAVHREASAWQKKQNSEAYKVSRNNYLKMIDGIVFGEDPREGYVENNVFYHPVMKFKYPVPSGWSLQNTPEQIKMAPKEGKGMMIFSFAGKGKLSAAAEASLQGLKLQVRERKELTINGFPALMTIGAQMAKDQTGKAVEKLRAVSAFIKYGEAIFAFHGVAVLEQFNTYYKIFDTTIKGFAPLKNYAKINRKPNRVRVKTVQTEMTLQQALQRFGVQQQQYKDIAILNNMKLTDKLEAGTLLKTIGK